MELRPSNSMKPMLFNTEMVRAILGGCKTVTRRVLKPQEKILKNPSFGYTPFTPKGHISVRGEWTDRDGNKRYGENFIKLPYCPGDILRSLGRAGKELKKMNRGILFQGKRIDNGEWVYGLLTIMWGQEHILDLEDENIVYPIDPATIGQYTGLTDKNGVKIFEGDIVRERLKGLEEAFHCVCLDYGRVFWYQKTARFLRTATIFSDDCQEMTEYHEYEVVGNIYDNPGFLEEEKNETADNRHSRRKF